MRASTTAPTLAAAAFPAPQVDARIKWAAREIALVLGFAWFVALCAQIAIKVPWTEVPVTGQTFAVLVTGGALGAWRGGASLGTYLLMGIIGIPVFAPSVGGTDASWHIHFILSSNWSWDGTRTFIWDPASIWALGSFGYIIGFIMAAMLVGWLAERQWDRKPWVHLGLFLGNVLLYVPGLLWLALWIAQRDLQIPGTGLWDQTLVWGLYPFIVGDLMKLMLASLSLPLGWAIVNRWKGSKTWT